MGAVIGSRGGAAGCRGPGGYRSGGCPLWPTARHAASPLFEPRSGRPLVGVSVLVVVSRFPFFFIFALASLCTVSPLYGHNFPSSSESLSSQQSIQSTLDSSHACRPHNVDGAHALSSFFISPPRALDRARTLSHVPVLPSADSLRATYCRPKRLDS